MDVVGYATTDAQMDAVRSRAARLAAPRARDLAHSHGWGDETRFVAGVCPHDDYYYAARHYALLLQRIRAKRVVIFGVSHHAARFGVEDRLVFDAFSAWRGPYGPVAVSDVREAVLAKLPDECAVVDDDMQAVEHSVEGIVSFLQACRRDVEIASILVPFMDWAAIQGLAGALGEALATTMRERGWTLGDDLALICSNDSVHYGDSGFDYAPYGTDAVAYLKAVDEDRRIAQDQLCGPLRPDKVREFMAFCTDPDDVRRYRVTWCGRFAVSLGLCTASRLAGDLEGRCLDGVLLVYGTSLSEESLAVQDLDGLGPTAPNNFHHFVGYATIGYL